jgi:hypothetical protein
MIRDLVADNITQSNETVVILDAGGGTIDAVTYRCVNGDPVRLAEEVIAPASESLHQS